MKKLSYNGQRALLLGNGINRTEGNNGIEWGDLLRKIANPYGIDVDLENQLKPFPLAFEEMLYAKEGRTDIKNKLRNLKSRISKIFYEDANNLIDNNIHESIMQCGIKEILTPNYDYNLETSIYPDFSQESFKDHKTEIALNNLESKHSLFRGYKINDVTVRHFHGELRHNRNITSENNYPEESIMIGFEHYSDYFLKIQNIIKGQSGKQKESEKKSLLVRIRDEDPIKSWTDVFFTHQLIIAGFSLDFSENHLWWILLQREELKRNPNQHDVRINNEIVFCYPLTKISSDNFHLNGEIEFNKLFKKKVTQQKNRAITDLLKSLSVKIDPIECDSYKEFYIKLIEKYQVI